MTAVTIDTVPAPSVGALGRIWRVVKLHVANPWPVLITPWMIMGIIFLANLVIWWIIHTAAGPNAGEASEGFQWSGASLYIFVYMMVVAVMAMNQSFAYALGFSSTRRDYYLGTALTFVLLSLLYTAGFTVLGTIERLTDGWGLNGRMFTAVYFGENPLTQAIAVLTLFLFFFFFGAMAGAVYVRWRASGMIYFFSVLGLVVIGGAALITFTDNWGAFANFFVTFGFLGSYLWSLVITALAGIAGFFILRRATPKS